MESFPEKMLNQICRILMGESPLTEDVLRDALSQGGNLRRTAIEIASKNISLASPVIFHEWLGRPSDEGALLSILVCDPALIMESRSPRDSFQPIPDGPKIQELFSDFRIQSFFSLCIDIRPDSEPGTRILRHFPALYQRLVFDRHSPWNEEEKSIGKRLFILQEKERYPPQVHLELTRSCNLKCPYCFARVEENEQVSDLSINQIHAILEASPATNRIGLFGGEPLLFREWKSLTDVITASGKSFFFSTNAVIPHSRFFEAISSPSLEMITLHIEGKSFYTSRQYSLLRQNLNSLSKSSFSPVVVVRYNISSSAIDLSVVDEALGILPQAHFSFAATFPGGRSSQSYISKQHLTEYAPKIVEIAKHVKLLHPKIPRIVLAKPYPICAFSENEFIDLLAICQISPNCELDKNGFLNQLMIRCDGSTSPCMALDVPLDSQKPFSHEMAANEYKILMHDIVGSPLFEKCQSCRLFFNGFCQGGCFAYR